MRVRLRALACAFVLCVGATPWSHADTESVDGVVVATVNGEAVYLEHLERHLAGLHSGLTETQRAAFDLDQLMFRVVNDVLIVQEARILGMHEEDPIPRRVAEKREELARARLESEEIWSKVGVTDEEVAAAFATQYQRMTFEILTVESEEQATAFRERAIAGESLAEMAKELGELPRGGYRRFEDVARTEVPRDLAAGLASLEEGAVGAPVPTRLGWTIVRLESLGVADPDEFASREERLREVLRFQKAEERSAALAIAARDTLGVEIDAQIADVRVERRPDGRLEPLIEDPGRAVATIGDREITAAMFGRALRNRWRSVRNEDAALASRSIVLDRLIEYELVTAEALRRGYDRTPEVERQVDAYVTSLVVPRFLDEVLNQGIEVSRDEMEAFYGRHRESFRRPPRLKLSQITVREEELAEQIASQLREGSDVAWLAREHSVDAFRDVGGDRGWLVPDVSFGDLRSVLLAAPAGEVIGPITEDDGEYRVLRVDLRSEQGIFSFEEMSGNVRQAVYSEKFRSRLDEVMQQLRESSEIVVHRDVLASLSLSGAVSAQGPHGTGLEDDGADRGEGHDR